MSVEYDTVINYRDGALPKVTVRRPTLVTRPGQALPHVYPGEELCLYYGREFVGTKHFISDTIVPWASEWLYFYEAWLTTGVWLGSAAPHPVGDVRERAHEA